MLPAAPLQIFVLVAFVMPGFIYQAAALQLRGQLPAEREQTARVLRAIALSVGFDCIYLLAFNRWLAEYFNNTVPVAIDRLPALAGAVLLLVFALPTLVAAMVHYFRTFRFERFKTRRSVASTMLKTARMFVDGSAYSYSNVASAWDFAAYNTPATYVRVRFPGSVWLGGFLGERGFINATPEPRELFVEVAWTLDRSGAFLDSVSGSMGMWINCKDALHVEYLHRSNVDSDHADNPEQSNGGRLERQA